MFRAIGFVIGLIAIRLMLPSAFQSFEHATVQFFGYTEELFAHPPTSIVQDMQEMQTAGISYIPKPAPLPSAYMQQ